MAVRYPIRAVAKATGLSLDTLRAWERRYKVVVPERSDRGRQYGVEDVDRLRLLARLVEKGHAIGTVAALPNQELENLLAPQSSEESQDPPPSRDLILPVLAAIERFDPASAADELGRLGASLSPRDLVYQVAIPLMREVGIRWHQGTLAIAQEHLISQMLGNLLGTVARLIRPSSPSARMIFATPAGELHEFGILASAMLTSMAGIEPIYLGPDLPSHEIAEAASRSGARVILLGITVIQESTAGEVRALAAAMPEPAELWLGGARAGELDLSNLGRKTVLLEDLPALESECRRWRYGSW